MELPENIVAVVGVDNAGNIVNIDASLFSTVTTEQIKQAASTDSPYAIAERTAPQLSPSEVAVAGFNLALTPGFFPIANDTGDNLEDSVMYQFMGKVGVNTRTPFHKFEVKGGSFNVDQLVKTDGYKLSGVNFGYYEKTLSTIFMGNATSADMISMNALTLSGLELGTPISKLRGIGVNDNGVVSTTMVRSDGTEFSIVNSSNATLATLTATAGLNLSTINHATTNTDKFLVSDTGVVKYRTAAEVLLDLDAVPYTGAYKAVNLGEWGITAGNFIFDTTPTGIPTAQGSMYWDAAEETVALIMNGTTQRVGQDLFYPVKNQTGSTIPKGTGVRFAGTLGASGRLLIAPFIANGTYPSKYFMGLTAEDIADGANGQVIAFGKIRKVNTSTFTNGDILYASTAVAGGFQTTAPTAPNNIITVAAVVYADATNGELLVRVSPGSNISEDEGIKLTSLVNKNILQYNSSNSLWENKSLYDAGIAGLGSTTINTLAYFDTVGTLASLNTSTYPSLTEVSYVKGVTSAIQTQLDGKQPLLSLSSGYIPYATGVSTLSNSIIYYNGTNIGINITSPAGIIHAKSSTAYGAIIIDNTGTTSGGVVSFRQNSVQLGVVGVDGAIQGNTSTDLGIFSETGSAIKFYTNGSATTKAYISTDGNLIINRALNDGVNKVQVNGSALFDGTMTANTIVKAGGTSSQFLKADGSVDGNPYVPESRTLTINGTTYDLSANRSWTISTGSALTGSGTSGQVTFWTGTSAISGESSFTWDTSNKRLTLGYSSGDYVLDTGSDIRARNVLIGSGIGATVGNTRVGKDSLINNTTGQGVTVMGYEAGYSNTTGYDNTFFGFQAGRGTLGGFENSFFGNGAGYGNAGGNYNSFFGMNAGRSNSTGEYNTFIGHTAGYLTIGGSNNTFVGYDAGLYNTSGSANVALGKSAGQTNLTGAFNIFLGHGADSSTTNLDNQIVIGYGTVGIGANATVIGNISTVKTAIYGRLLLNSPFSDDGTSQLQVNGVAKATSFVKSGGTSAQYLMADGSVSTSAGGSISGLTSGYIPYATASTSLGNSPFYYNGTNIGLNTTSPAGLFHMKAAGAYGKLVIDNSSATGGGYVSMYKNGSQIGVFGVSGVIYGDTSSDMGLFCETGSALLFFSNGNATPAMKLTTGRNFLIRTTTDNGVDVLQVNGSASFTSTVAASNGTLIGGSSTSGYLGYWSGTNTMAGSVNLFWNNTTKALGLGTASPLVETNRNGIVVRGGTAGAEFVLQSTSSTDGTYDGFSMAMEVNQAYLYNKRNGSIRFGANNALKAELKTNGDFDITGAYLVNGVPISTSGITGTMTSGFLPKATGTSTVGNSALYDAGSYVMGIGTTSPLLSTSRQGIVIRGGSTGAELVLQSTSSTDGTYDGLSIAMDGNTAYMFNKRNGDLQLGANNARRATLTTAGDFDITGTYKVNGVALSSGIGGSGTTSYIPKFATGTTLGDSGLYDGGTHINITYGALRLNNYLALSESGSIINVGFDGALTGVALTVGGTEKLRVNSQGVKAVLPTSSSGLSSGQLWNDSGTVKIV